MNISSIQFNAISQIEAAIHQDVGRHMERAFYKTRGNLCSAAVSIVKTERPSIGIMTGFFIERALPPAAETDGPLGAALLAFALNKVGVECRVITDSPCAKVCRTALDSAGAHKVSLDVVTDSGTSLQVHRTLWEESGITHVISTERPGRSHSGAPRNMNGDNIVNCVLFDDLFTAGQWRKIAIGDGGNEIGMGSLPYGLVSADIKHGREIACLTEADDLITAGVSNWGANALMAAMAILKPEWQEAMNAALTPERETRTLRSMVKSGAIDGISYEKKLSIDTLPIQTHLKKTAEILAITQSARQPIARKLGWSLSLDGGQRLTA